MAADAVSSSAAATTADEEVLQHLARQGRRVPIPVFVGALVIGAMAFRSAPPAMVPLWLGCVLAVLVVRYLMLGKLGASTAGATADRLRTAIALSAANGIVFGASLAFTPYLTVYERVVQALLLLGLCTGSVATTAGYLPVHLAFTVPTIGALAAAWLAFPGAPLTPWIGRSVGLLTLCFGALLFGMARDARRLFVDSFEMRQQQSEMNIRLREALDAAEAANRAKTRFLASASHDLRQPMHTLSLFAEALWLQPLDPATRGIAGHLRTASLALGTQLDALLDISKLDAAVVQVNAVEVDLGALVRRLHQQYIPEAERRHLGWRLSANGEFRCRTDPLLFERVLRNLVDNAFKYTAQGEVRMALFSRGAEHVIRIADTGVGIPAEEQERVFEEFYQVDNPERDRARGLGLGLSIVQRLSHLLDARLHLESSLGRGTTIEVALAGVIASTVEPVVDATAPEVTGLHVLVIDDEEQVRLGMQTLLKGLGCSADLVGSTAEALGAAAARKPHIVIADFRLRGTDNGLTAIHDLRDVMPGLPALLLSGDTAPDRLRDAHSAGIRMLHKPVTLDQLLNAMEHELTI